MQNDSFRLSSFCFVHKIQERCQNAVLLNMKGEPRQGSNAAIVPVAKSESKPVVRPKTAQVNLTENNFYLVIKYSIFL